ncbi:MAG: hypothetical protein R6X05_04200 [Desulfobacterales bacterium]
MKPLSDIAFVCACCRRLPRVIWGLGLAALLLSGCASYNSHVQAQSFARVTRSYGLALEWSDYEAAANFLEHAPPPEDIAHLKAFKVTAYEIRRVQFLDDDSHVDQTVAIHYYKTDELIERTYIDQQSWVFRPQEKTWYLRSGLPGLG